MGSEFRALSRVLMFQRVKKSSIIPQHMADDVVRSLILLFPAPRPLQTPFPPPATYAIASTPTQAPAPLPLPFHRDPSAQSPYRLGSLLPCHPCYPSSRAAARSRSSADGSWGYAA